MGLGARRQHSAAYYDGMAYVFTGYTSVAITATVERYKAEIVNSDGYIATRDVFVQAYANATLTNQTNANTGKGLYLKSGDLVTTDTSTDILII